MTKHLFLAVAISILLCPATPAQEPTDTIQAKELSEVVVTAAREATRIDGDGMTTAIQGTVLQDLGTAKEVLGCLPGVINNNGTIEVVGKGSPIFYINGRPMRDESELNQLQSAQIKNVKVINNPGARYGSDVSAVIRITTVKNLGDGFALDTKTVGGYRDYLYGNELVKMNYRTDGLDIFGSLNYDYSKNKNGLITNQSNLTSRPTGSTLSAQTVGHQHLGIGKIGFNYETASGHSFGAYYLAAIRPIRQNSRKESTFTVENEPPEPSTLSNNESFDFYQHMVDGYYCGKWGNWDADFAIDYLWINSLSKQHNKETLSDNATSTFNFRNDDTSSMLAAEFNLSRPIWKGSLNLGAAYYNSSRSNNFQNPEAMLADADNRVQESNLGVYAESRQKFGKIELQLGLRYEHTDNNYYEENRRISEQSRRYNELLPSANLVIPVGSSTFQLSYSRQTQRPAYGQLYSTIIYNNKYLYETGNPSLRTAFFNILTINYKWHWLMVTANYKHITDKVITTAEAYSGNPDITLLKKHNSPNAINVLEGFASVSPGLIGKYYYPMLMAGVTTQFYSIDYRGAQFKLNHPLGIIRFNNIIKLPNDFTLTANLYWRSRGNGENVRVATTWQIDFSIAKTFNRHWDVKLAVNDIFNTARSSSFTMYSGVCELFIDKISTRRAIELTLNYHFNFTKSKYKGTGAGADERQRL